MPSSNRTFRVFVSSTFSDLEAERSALQEKVFPKLKQLCLEHGCRFQAIDLRWGVREEAAYDQQTLKICLEEIKRCQKTKLKPNFIVLLGDRYGWRPAPPEIPEDEFEKIEKHLSKEDTDRFRKWYLLDSNAVPAVYCLQPRTGEYRKQENWEQVEAQLRSILLKGITEEAFSEEERVKYFESATEQEINQGLSDPDAQKHVFGFFRKIEGIEKNPGKGFADLDKITGKLDEEAHNRLLALKDKLRTCLPDHCFEYQADRTNKGITKDHIDKLCMDVRDSLLGVIQEQIKHISEVDPLGKEIDDHAVFGEERGRFFVGRQTFLGSIKDYLGGVNNQPLAVFGEPGSGKTSLMAHAIQETRKGFPDVEIVFRFVGATPSSTDGRSLLESLCVQIYKFFNFEEQKNRQVARIEGIDEEAQQKRQQIEAEYSIPAEYQKLSMTFRDFVNKIPQEEKAVIFLDALDQLSSTDNARDLSWLPTALPNHIHLVVSCLPGDCQSILEKRLPPRNIVIVKPMSRGEGKDLLKKWLDNASRLLQQDQEKTVIDKFAICGMPLYLKLAFEEARRWKSYDEKIELNPTMPGIIRDMFKRLSYNENYGEKMLSHSLSYLAAAKNGLTEDELLDVLSLDLEVFDDFRKSSFHELSGGRLPVVVWSRLYSDLEPYLTERSADGTSLLGFYHRQLNEVVVHEYLKEDTKPLRHSLLGHYFNGDFDGYSQPLQRPGKRKATYNLRKLSELPYQETFGKLWSQLEYTLTDLAFIEAKCASEMTFDLVNDFKVALNALPERQEERNIELRHQELVQKYTQDLIVFARGENKSLEILPSVELWSENKIDEDTERILCNPTRFDRIRCFSQFINAESHSLQKFASYPGFLVQQAYNYTRSGPLADAAEKRIKNKTPRILFLHENFWRPEYNPHPALVKTLTGHTSAVRGVCCTPDGKLVISASGDGTLRVWDPESGECKKTLIDHTNKVTHVCCTPDGKLAISASWDGTLGVWDLESGECKKTLTDHTNAIHGVRSCVCCSADGKLAISDSEYGTLRVWDLESGKCKKTLTGHTNSVNCVCCTADGKLAISASDDMTLRVWNIETGECKRILTSHNSIVHRVCCTPDGKLVISASGDGTLRVWDPESGECKKTLTGDIRTFYSLCCTPDGKLAISDSEYGTLGVWDLESGECKKTLTDHTNAIHGVCCTADGKLAISASDDMTLRVWNIETGECKRILTSHTGPVNFVCCTPDGKLAISASGDGHLLVLDLETGECKKTLMCRGDEIVSSLCCTPDGKFVISASNIALRMWELENGYCIKTLTNHSGVRSCVCCTPDGKLAILTNGNGPLFVWDLETEECKTLPGQTHFVHRVWCTPDGKLAISASGDGHLLVLDLETGECKKTLTFHTHETTHVCCTPDGKLAISASYDGPLIVWDLKSGYWKKKLTGHTARVTDVCCTTDGKLVISASEDGTLRVWDLKTGDCIWVYQARSISYSLFLGSRGRFVVGNIMGELVMLKVSILDAAPPLLTPVRLWLFENRNKNGWDDAITVTCTWCGQRFVVEQKIIETIQNLSTVKSKSLRSNLTSNCPHCSKSVRFNPLIVDNKEAIYEQHAVNRTPKPKARPSAQKLHGENIILPPIQRLQAESIASAIAIEHALTQKNKSESAEPKKLSRWKKLFKR